MAEALFFYNPEAGRHPPSEQRLQAMRHRLQEQGIRTEVVPAPAPGTRLRLDLEGKDLILVYGGDGTIHQVLNYVLPRPIPMAILPAGTANVLAQELGIPRHPQDALELVFQGRLRRIYLGQSGEDTFHLMAGVGLDGYIISRVGRLLKKIMGVGAFWLVGLIRFWSYPMPVFRVEIEGRRYRSTFTVVANARYYGGHLVMAPQASVFEPVLDVCVFTSTSRRRYIEYMRNVLRGRHPQLPDVHYEKTRRVRIEGPSGVLVQMDGELKGPLLPRSFSLLSNGIPIFVPD